MTEKPETDYESLKAFLAFYSERYFGLSSLPPEIWPINVLEAMEKKNKKAAVMGLRQAVNDCVERSFDLEHAEVEGLDAELRSYGIVTLSELRRRYSKGYAKILKRGRIKNETEYYLMVNVANDPTEKAHEERDLLDKLISDYEKA